MDKPRPLSHTAPLAALTAQPWRVGQSTGRAIYCGRGDHEAIAWADTPELAEFIVEAVNTYRAILATPLPQPQRTVRLDGPRSREDAAPAEGA